jgi:hypothetical protein
MPKCAKKVPSPKDSNFSQAETRRLVQEMANPWEDERPTMNPHSSLIDALHTNGPAEDRKDKVSLYSWLIGDWDMQAVVRGEDGTAHRGRGEIHFGWVLEGRAIQDVWILPGVFYGTTLRVYDPDLDAWHILWNDPLKQFYARQIGRARGGDIVQEGTDGAGTPIRWSFTNITPNSFRWLGERSVDGESWQLQAEFLARRVAPNRTE